MRLESFCSIAFLGAVSLAACKRDGASATPPDASALDSPASKPDAAPDATPESETAVCNLTVVPPDPTGDVEYDFWQNHQCFDEPCLCAAPMRPFVDDLLSCKAIMGGYRWNFGSIALRVLGRQGGQCNVRIGVETEGDVRVLDCALPLPMHPWPGLAWSDIGNGMSTNGFLEGIEDRCVEIGHCSVIWGGPNECWNDTALLAPYCTSGSPIKCPTTP